MKRLYLLLPLLPMLLLTAIHALAWDEPPTQVSILTMAPGKDIYELEGHAALRINSPQTGDITVDWGVFDFTAPNFVYRFVSGQTDYSVGMRPTKRFLMRADVEGRRVMENVLDLTPAQIDTIIDLVGQNFLDGNRIYRYNYVRDNCSTRVYTMIERALGDTITFPPLPEVIAKRPTWRKLMTRYHANYPWYQFGIDLALGNGIDMEVSNRQALYAPIILEYQLPLATVGGRRLVKETRVIEEGVPGGIVEGPTPFLATPMFMGLVILALSILLTWRDLRRNKLSRWFDTVYYNAAGIGGLVLAFLIFVSTHEATSPNWVFLWLNPLCFIGGILIWLKKCKKIVFYWQIVNFVLLSALLVIGISGVQSLNPAFYPLILADMTRSTLYIYRNVKPTKQ